MAQRQTLQTVLACGKLRFHELQVRLYIFVNLLLVFITKFLTNVLGPSYELLMNFLRTRRSTRGNYVPGNVRNTHRAIEGELNI